VHYGIVETTAPAAEPVTTTEAKDWARVSISDDDTLVDALVASARAMCEAYTGRAFVNTTFTMSMDDFPSATVFEMPRAPLGSVTSITYTDATGTTGQTMSSGDYIVDTTSEPGRVALAYNASWPDTYDEIDVIAIVFVAGYGAAASAVPDAIKTAIKELVAFWYGNREAATDLSLDALPFGVKALLDPYRVDLLR
jgi:uncharacterized phiE125 gp8 family phage protein